MRCLILGYGYMGKIRHGVLRDHPLVSEVAVYDPGIDPLKENIQNIYLNPNQEIPWEKFDTVFVCTPNNITAKYCALALKYCRNVFCEKPPGRGWEDFLGIEEAARAALGHVLVFGFNHRFHPSIQSAMALIGDDGLGDVLYIKGTYGKSGGAHYRESWRNQREISGGGILLDQGIHMLDLFQYFLGPLTVINGHLRDSFWNCGVEDNAFVLLQSQSGTPAFLHSSATLWKHTFQIEIGLKNGYLMASGLLSKTGSYGREQLVIGRRQFEDEASALGNPREEIIYFDRDDSWQKEVHEFLTAIKEKRPATHGTLEEAKRVMAIIRDVYQQSSGG